MQEIKFPKLPPGSFENPQEEQEYLYSLLDFTLNLDSIEDENPHLISFLKDLLELLAPLLEVDEIAILLKDFYLNSWMPLISFPEGETLHNSLDLKFLLNAAEATLNSQQSHVIPLKSLNGGFLTFPLIFQEQSFGVLFLFQYEFEAENTIKKDEEFQLSRVLNPNSEQYTKVMRLLWYINELENDAIRDRLEIWETQSILGKYISSQVMEKIFRSPTSIDLEGQEIEITVLFADLCDFTKISESLPSKQVVKLLNTIWTLLVEIAFKFQGTVDKFMGDCIMVVFNSPIAQKDHYFRAAATAVEFRECIQRLSEEPEWNAYGLQVSIGINTGHATCGNIGSKERMEYTVIGDSVNLAARLEMVAKPGEILISEGLFQKIEGGFWIEKGEKIRVKGKSNPIQVYRLERNYSPSDVESGFLDYPASLQKNILTTLTFSPTFPCAKVLCQYLPQCEREVGLQIFSLMEKYYCVEILADLMEWVETVEDPFYLSKCTKTIGFLGGARNLEQLLPFLKHPDVRVIANTIEAIGLTEYKESFQLLHPFLKHENHRVRLWACQVCWNDNQDLVLDQFITALLSPDSLTQKAVLVMLREVDLSEILFSFLERYANLPDKDKKKIRGVVMGFGDKKLQRYLTLTEDKYNPNRLEGKQT